MIVAVLFFLVAVTMVVFGVLYPVLHDIQTTTRLIHSKQSFAYAEGLLEDISYRTMRGMNLSSEESLTYRTGTVVASSTIIDTSDERVASVRGDVHDNIRKLRGAFVEGDGVTFNYGVQSGEGGVVLENSSTITGNLFSNGTITGSGNVIGGGVISAGPTGLVDNIHATGTVYAHTIKDSTIDKDAYYYDNNITNTTVGGTMYPDSPDQPTSTLPISDEQIREWEQGAEDGGTITSCPYEINSDTTIGPVKIACDFTISGNTTVTIAGAVWVAGDITVNNQATMRIDSSYDSKSVPVIAHDRSATSTKGRIVTKNNTTFEGSGEDGSYLLFVSQNNSAETGGSTSAIHLQDKAEGKLLLYAGHGEIRLENNISLKEVTGYNIHLRNSAEVIYESGLANLLFSTGPSGGFSINGWREAE